MGVLGNHHPFLLGMFPSFKIHQKGDFQIKNLQSSSIEKDKFSLEKKKQQPPFLGPPGRFWPKIPRSQGP